MIKNNASVLSKVYVVWNILRAGTAYNFPQYCPKCGSRMLYLGETCSLDTDGFDREYKCMCTRQILIVKGINCDNE